MRATIRLTAHGNTTDHCIHGRGSTSPDCRLDDFRAEVTRDTDLADYPHAVDVRENVLVYPATPAAPTGGPCRPS